jgi:hypothetical protein
MVAETDTALELCLQEGWRIINIIAFLADGR